MSGSGPATGAPCNHAGPPLGLIRHSTIGSGPGAATQRNPAWPSRMHIGRSLARSERVAAAQHLLVRISLGMSKLGAEAAT